MHEEIIIARQYKEAAASMQAAAESFSKSVFKLGSLLGMQAENDQRKHLGQSLAFVQTHFESVLRDEAALLEKNTTSDGKAGAELDDRYRFFGPGLAR